jgi:phage anti-repressor protein
VDAGDETDLTKFELCEQRLRDDLDKNVRDLISLEVSHSFKKDFLNQLPEELIRTSEDSLRLDASNLSRNGFIANYDFDLMTDEIKTVKISQTDPASKTYRPESNQTFRGKPVEVAGKYSEIAYLGVAVSSAEQMKSVAVRNGENFARGFLHVFA